MRVIFASPKWHLSGVNTFSVNLAREMRAQGISASILLTDPSFHPDGRGLMPLPTDIPIEKLPVQEQDNWPTRWQRMIDYLEQQAPCIYIPNYDQNYSCVSPKLSQQVAIVGIVHSDDLEHYDHVDRLGKYWNAIVAVSEAINRKTSELDPQLASKLFTIHYGVSIPKTFHQRTYSSGSPLKIVYVGRLVQHQKRILDLPKIVGVLSELQIPIELTVIGDGAQAHQLQEESGSFVELGLIKFIGTLPNEKVLELYERNDIFILTSEFEGMPVALLEAMGRGCIPVVTDIPSGVPELIQDGVSGYRVPVGDIQLFAERIATLYQDQGLQQRMSLNAYLTVDQGEYRSEDMVKKYVNLFQQVMTEVEAGYYKRPTGKILPPLSLRKELQDAWKKRVPPLFRNLGKYGKQKLVQFHSVVKSIST